MGVTDSPHPRKQDTRGLDTIQATSFFSWRKHFEAKGDLLKNLRNDRPSIMSDFRFDSCIYIYIFINSDIGRPPVTL